MQALKNMDVVITVVVVVLCLLRLYTSHLAERQEQAAWRKRKLFSHNGWYRDGNGEMQMINPKLFIDRRHTDYEPTQEDREQYEIIE
jgi:hypothetical protein